MMHQELCGFVARCDKDLIELAGKSDCRKRDAEYAYASNKMFTEKFHAMEMRMGDLESANEELSVQVVNLEGALCESAGKIQELSNELSTLKRACKGKDTILGSPLLLQDRTERRVYSSDDEYVAPRIASPLPEFPLPESQGKLVEIEEKENVRPSRKMVPWFIKGWESDSSGGSSGSVGGTVPPMENASPIPIPYREEGPSSDEASHQVSRLRHPVRSWGKGVYVHPYASGHRHSGSWSFATRSRYRATSPDGLHETLLASDSESDRGGSGGEVERPGIGWRESPVV